MGTFYEELQKNSPAALKALEEINGSELLTIAARRQPALMRALDAIKAQDWDNLDEIREEDHEELVKWVSLLGKFAITVGDTYFCAMTAAFEAKALEPRRTRRAQATNAARAKQVKNPAAKAQGAAMIAIKNEWLVRKRAGMRFTATAFAKEMATKHRNIVTPEYLKNQQTKWNKEYHPAS